MLYYNKVCNSSIKPAINYYAKAAGRVNFVMQFRELNVAIRAPINKFIQLAMAFYIDIVLGGPRQSKVTS